MPVPLALITRLFQLLLEKKFAEAERVLERITVRMKENRQNEFNTGYLQALKGIFLSHRSGSDSDTLFSNLNLMDIDTLKKHRKDFLSNARNSFHADYDRGYFSALSDYTNIILKTASKSKEG